MQHHPTYDDDTDKQSKRRRLDEQSTLATIDTQCLFCNIPIERSSSDTLLEHMEYCLTRLTEGNQIRRNKHRSGVFSKMTTCPACNMDSPFHFKNIRDKARHLKQCLVSNGTTLSDLMDARDSNNAKITTIDLSSPSPPPVYQGNNRNNDVDLTILDDDDFSLLDPFSASNPLEEVNVTSDNKRTDSVLLDESPSYTHADSIDSNLKDNIDLTIMDDSPRSDSWLQQQGSISEFAGDQDTTEANDTIVSSSQQLDKDIYKSNDQQYSPMEDEYLAQLLLDRLCNEQQFTPSPLFSDLKSCATSLSNSLEARKRCLDTFERVFFNQQLNLSDLVTMDQPTLIQDTRCRLSQVQVKFLYNVIQEMQTPECTAGISWVFEDYSLDANTILAIERLTELDSRLARILCLLDIASHHPMFAAHENRHQQHITQRHDTQPFVDDDDDPVIAVDLTGNSDHSAEILLSSSDDIVDLDFDDEESIPSYSDVIQSQLADNDTKESEQSSSDSSVSRQQAKDTREDSCHIGINTPPNVHADDMPGPSDNKDEDDAIFHFENLTNRELNFFADTYGLESGMRKQNIALLNRIWKERACQVSNSISDDDNEPVSVEGSSNSVDLVRHLKSQRDIWNKMLRYECVDLEDYDGSDEFTSHQIRRKLDEHGFLKRSQ